MAIFGILVYDWWGARVSSVYEACIDATPNVRILYTRVKPVPRKPPMAALMNADDFRTALEEAIKGRAATKAPFSVAWASGKLSREHLARWAENHYHYVGP